jgi:prepilin-type processing-associated H-X9-DG protein
VADYCAIAQVKTKKNASGAEIAAANPILVPFYPNGPPSKGAERQNAITPIVEITDGTSNTTLYSEAAAKDTQYFTNYVNGGPNTSVTGAIWADSDNRITVTGTSADGRSQFGTGPCVMNCNNLQGDIYSFHTSGANICFADGSVRFVRESITIDVLTAMVTKTSGEIVDIEKY